MSGNPIDSFDPLLVAPKNKWKINKKMVKKCKHNTQNGIKWVWNELWPKVQQLAFNKGHFEKLY